MMTGWATLFSESIRRGDAPEHEFDHRVVLSAYVAESMQARAPLLFADDLEHGRHVLDATIHVVEALCEQRRRFSRDRDIAALADAAVTFVMAHDGRAALAATDRYRTLVDAWNRTAPADQARYEPRAAILFGDEFTALAECVATKWRVELARVLGHVPGVVMTGMHAVDVSHAMYTAWLERRQAHVAASSMHLYDIEYTVHDGLGNGDDSAPALHEQAARHGLAPLVDAVEELRGSYAPDRVRLDWTLNILCAEAAPAASHADDNDTSSSDDDVEEPPPRETRIHCSVAYKAYVLADTH